MADDLKGKVAIVTGGGRGLGKSHALHLAQAGVAVIVNDPGVTLSGDQSDLSPGDAVVATIRAAGGRAVASTADCADWAGAASLVESAIDHFGRLDILVNNAGILRDRMSFNLSEDDFDAVVRVHLKGHFAPSHHAARHWRAIAKAGSTPGGSIINTTSEAGLIGSPGQVNYGAAKAGIAAMTVIMAQELASIGVRVNAISPRAATRFTEKLGLPAQAEHSPDAVSRLVTYLAGDAARAVSGRVFFIYEGGLALMRGWSPDGAVADMGERSVDAIGAIVDELLTEALPPIALGSDLARLATAP